MYIGRDMTELTMMAKQDWTNNELSFFHQNLQQITPYLNAEGVTIRREIIKEIISRGGIQHEDESNELGTSKFYQ